METLLNKNILDRIIEWAKIRGLDKLHFNLDETKANQAEENAELWEAISNYYRSNREHKYLYEIIDAHADKIIYAIVDSLKKGYTDTHLKEYFKDIVITSRKEIEDKGFNFDLVMDETLKEIESRTGSWCDTQKKWVKDKIQKNRYKADYSKCRF